MKHKLQTLLKHKLQWLLLLMALLGVSQGVWGTTTYYVYGGTTSHNDAALLGWSTQQTTATGDDNSFDVSISISSNSKDADYYYGICRSSSKFLPNGGSTSDYNDHIIPDGITGSVSGVSVGKEGINAGSCHFYTIKIRKTSDAATSVTLHFAKTGNNYTQCDQTQKGWNLSISGQSVDEWSLRGEFTNWNQSPVTFVKSGDTYSASISLPANHTYRCCNGGEGFKVTKNGSVWYGINQTVTSDNALTPKGFENNDDGGWNCGLETTLAGTYTFQFTLSNGNPQVTVIYPSKLPTVPTVRWGKEPTVDGSKNINATAYVAAQGCDGTTQQKVKQLKVRFWKDGEPENIGYIETAIDNTGFDMNSVHDVIDVVTNIQTIPASDPILMSCTSDTYIYMEVAGYSDKGWSDYSDRVKVPYKSNTQFLTHNITLNQASACDDGKRTFAISSMVLPTSYDSWAVAQTSPSAVADAKSHFNVSDGNITWLPADRDPGTYIYAFAFEKEGYTPDGTAILTVNYAKENPTGNIGDIEASPSVEDPINPYVDITLSATKGTGVSTMNWYVKSDKSRVILTPNADGTQCVFRAKAYTSQKTYKVYAQGLSSSCGTTDEKYIEITVRQNSEVCPKE